MIDYIPSQDVLEYLHAVDFVGVVGPTAVGKSTLIERAMDRDPAIHLVRSTTSRSPRPGEEDGVDMHFRSKEAMSQRIAGQEYVTAIQLFENIYATAPEDYAETGVSVLPMAADAAAMFAQRPFHSFRVIFVLPPSYAVWMDRIAGRATNELDKRLQEARESLRYALGNPDVIFVLNDDLDVATESFVAVLHGTAPDTEQQAACRALAEELLEQLVT